MDVDAVGFGLVLALSRIWHCSMAPASLNKARRSFCVGVEWWEEVRLWMRIVRRATRGV